MTIGIGYCPICKTEDDDLLYDYRPSREERQGHGYTVPPTQGMSEGMRRAVKQLKIAAYCRRLMPRWLARVVFTVLKLREC